MKNVFGSILIMALTFSFAGQAFAINDNRLEITMQARYLDMIPTKTNGQFHVSTIIVEIRDIKITEEAEQDLAPIQKNLLRLLRKHAKEINVTVELQRLSSEKLQSLDAYCLVPNAGEWKGRLVSELKVLLIPTIGYEGNVSQPFVAVLLDHQHPDGDPNWAVKASLSSESIDAWFDVLSMGCESSRKAITGAIEMYNMDHSAEHMKKLDLELLRKDGYIKAIPVCPNQGIYRMRCNDNGSHESWYEIECSFHSRILSPKHDSQKRIDIPQPNFDVNVICKYCGGTGKDPHYGQRCTACGGDGWVSSPDNPRPCANCRGTGKDDYGQKCSVCDGSGWANTH